MDSPRRPRAASHTTLVLLRHGEVDSAYRDRLYGAADVPLSKHGRDRSVMCARTLDPLVLDTIYTSDLERTRLLAHELARPRRLEVIESAKLREIERGRWVGRLRSEMAVDPQWAAYCDDPDHYQGHGAESGAALVHRVRGALRRIAAQQPGRAVAVVCHRHVVCAALSALLAVSFKAALRFQVDTLSGTVLDWPREGEASRDMPGGTVRLVNGTARGVLSCLGTRP